MGKGLLAFLASLFLPLFSVLILVITGLGAYTKSGPGNGIETHLTLLKLLFFGVPIVLIGLYYGLRERNRDFAKGYLWGGIFWIGLYVAFLLLFLLPPFIQHWQIESKFKKDVQEGRYQRRAFRNFANKFEKVDLPYSYRLTTKKGGNISKMVMIDKNSIDTMFVKTPNFDDTYCLGMISDTSDFYALIYFFPGYYYYPVLATYSKTGEFINQKPLTVTSCDSTCGLSYCSQTVALDQDFFIKSKDSIYYKYKCHVGNVEKEPLGLLKTISFLGKVNKNGIIELEKKLRKDKAIPNSF